MNKSYVNEIVERAMSAGNHINGLEKTLRVLPAPILEKTIDYAAELYNDAIEDGYFSSVSRLDERRAAQREYAFRRAAEFAINLCYMKQEYDQNPGAFEDLDTQFPWQQ